MKRENGRENFFIKTTSIIMLLITVGSILPVNLIASVVEESLRKI